MQIFYINNKANSVLLVNIKNSPVTKISTYDDYTILFHNDDVVGINIFGKINEFNLVSGPVFASKELLDWINNKTDIVLQTQQHFVVCEVSVCDEIPNTHLHKCIVTDGTNNYNVVCGAKNVCSGLHVVFAKANTIMPNGKEIVPGTLMGYQSDGMLCSYKELGIISNQQGIIEVGDEFNLGDEFMPVYRS